MCRPQLSLTQAKRSQVDLDGAGKSSNTCASRSSGNRAQLPKQQCGLTWTIQLLGAVHCFAVPGSETRRALWGDPAIPSLSVLSLSWQPCKTMSGWWTPFVCKAPPPLVHFCYGYCCLYWAFLSLLLFAFIKLLCQPMVPAFVPLLPKWVERKGSAIWSSISAHCVHGVLYNGGRKEKEIKVPSGNKVNSLE